MSWIEKNKTYNIICKAATSLQDKLSVIRWEFMPTNQKRQITALYFVSDDYFKIHILSNKDDIQKYPV